MGLFMVTLSRVFPVGSSSDASSKFCLGPGASREPNGLPGYGMPIFYMQSSVIGLQFTPDFTLEFLSELELGLSICTHTNCTNGEVQMIRRHFQYPPSRPA
jgi:hypothetical protein